MTWTILMTCRSADDDVGAMAGRLLNETTGLEGFATGEPMVMLKLSPQASLLGFQMLFLLLQVC